MYNKEKFIKDYIGEAEHRLYLAEISLNKEKYNSVIRECQVSLELAIKALLFSLGRVIPKSHNLKEDLLEIKDLLSKNFQKNFLQIYKFTSKLRIDRERALYGDPDLNLAPSEIFSKEKAQNYFNEAKKILNFCKEELKDFLEK